MGYPVTLNGRTYTLADFSGQNYAAGFPDALEDFVTDAGAKVTAAASSATAAAASETAAAASAAAAAASVDAIEGFYLGAQASNPTVDLNGAAVTVGDFYFNTTTNQTRIYDGSSWNVIAPDLVGDASPQLGGNLDFNSYIATSFESTGIDDNATGTRLIVNNDGIAVGNTGANPATVNGSIAVNATASLGAEFIAGTNDTTISAGAFMGGYIFKNADSTGSPPHYAGMWAESEDTSGNMNLYLAGGNGRYESGTSDIFIEGSTGFVGFNEPAPEANLHIRNRTGVASSIRLERNDTSLSTGNGIGQIQFAHQDSGNEGVAATLRVEAGDSSGSGDFVFQTGLAGTLGDRVRIDHDGHLHVYGGIVDLTDEESPSLPVSIESTLTNGGGGDYDSSLKDSGQLQYNAASHLFADTSTVSSGFPQAWYEIDNGFRWGLGSSEYLTINSNGKMSLGAPASQGTHELAVREGQSPRISIDDTGGTSTDVNAGLLLRYDTTNAGTFGFSGTTELLIKNHLAGDINYETGAEHSFTIGGVEEVKITNTETNIYGASGDILVLNDTNNVASSSDIGNVRIAWDDSAGTRVAYIGTVNSDDFYINNQYSQVVLTHAGVAKAFTRSAGWGVTGTIEASGKIVSNGSGAGNAMFQLEEVGNNPWNILQYTGGAFSIQYNGTSTSLSSLCILTDGKIGLGTTNPQRELQINLDSTTTTTLGEKGGIEFFSASSTAGNGGELTWCSGTGSTERWCTISGHITTNTANGSVGDIVFASKAADTETTLKERMRIGGNTGTVTISNGTGNGNLTLAASDTGNEGGQINFATVSAGNFSIDTFTDDLRFLNGTSSGNYLFYTNSNASIGATLTGAGDLTLAGGIKFNSDTSANNELDDYEEGTYTAQIFDAGTGGNQSSTTKTGYYTKVGRLVTVTIWAYNNINTSGMTSSAVVYVTLPFTAGSTGRYVGSVNTHGFTYSGSGSGFTNIVPKITQSSSRMNFASNGNGMADGTVKVSDISSGADDIVDLSITYHV